MNSSNAASNAAFKARYEEAMARVFRNSKNANTQAQEARVDREAAEILRNLRATAESKTSRNRKIALALLAVVLGGGAAALAYKTVLGKTAISAAVRFGGALPRLLTGGRLTGLMSGARAKLWSAATAVSGTLGRLTDPITRWWSPHLMNNSQYVKYMRESNLFKHRLAVLGGAATAGTTLGKAALARVTGSSSLQSPPLNNGSLHGSLNNGSSSSFNHAAFMRALQNQNHEPSAEAVVCRYGVSTRTGACRERPRSSRRTSTRRHSSRRTATRRHSSRRTATRRTERG